MKILKNIVVFIIIFMFIAVPILLQPYNDAGVRKFAKDWPTTTVTISGIYPERGNQIKRKYKFSYCIDKENAHPIIMYIDETTGTYYQEKIRLM